MKVFIFVHKIGFSGAPGFASADVDVMTLVYFCSCGCLHLDG